MSLPPGARLGPYEILAAIGAGGMGEVYRARDTRLDRTVAIKVLPGALAADAQFRERFQREARVISQLSHSHICTLHDVGEAVNPGSPAGADDRVQFLVLEHLDGETLEDRLTRGALPLQEALKIAIEIADALCAAHRAGVVHRDLKPGNIFIVRGSGKQSPPHAKLLDFGLAKNTAPIVAVSGSMAPTTPANVTAQGTILGTFQYMAPEQIEGLEANARTDIFAFGAVLFEMVTGRKAFEGKTRASLLGAILKDEPPPVSQVHKLSPVALDRIVKTCLEKDPDDRWQSARDLLRELKWVVDGGAVVVPSDTRPMASRGQRWMKFGAAAAAALLSLAATAWLVAQWVSPPAPQPMRFAIVPPASQPLAAITPDRRIAISPDGRRLVYGSLSESLQLIIRPIDRIDAAAIRGLVQPRGPFFSPDGNWIGFFQATTELKKVAVTGGPALLICRVPGDGSGPRGASWGADGTIVFATSDRATGLLRVPSDGGEVAVLTKPDTAAGEEDHVWPSVLPDGNAVLFTVTSSTSDDSQIATLDLKSGVRKTLIRGGAGAQYLAGGYLVYGVAGVLHAVRFDAARQEVSGDPVRLVEGVQTVVTAGSAEAPDFSLSRSGTLVYAPASEGSSQPRTLVWVDRQGHEEPIPAPPRFYQTARLSPDGTRIAAGIRGQREDVWLWDFARQTLGRLTVDSAVEANPLWFPDGRRIAYTSSGNLFWRFADGTRSAEAVSDPPGQHVPMSFSPDGSQLVVSNFNPKTFGDLMLVKPETKGEAAPLLRTPSEERLAEISPDGRWIAYQSDESGQHQVYVRPFPNMNDGKWLISPQGGTNPAWNRNGRELFFLDARIGEVVRTLFAVSVQADPDFRSGTPVRLFEGPYRAVLPFMRSYDVAPDGKRFLMIKSAQATQTTSNETPASMVVVVNWQEELKRLVP